MALQWYYKWNRDQRDQMSRRIFYEEKGDERLADGVSLYGECGCQLLPLRMSIVWNPREFRFGRTAEVELSAEKNSLRTTDINACRFSHNLETLDSRLTMHPLSNELRYGQAITSCPRPALITASIPRFSHVIIIVVFPQLSSMCS